jgi:hypothetical protein
VKIAIGPSSNKNAGTAWRDLLQVDAEYSPLYIGEASTEELARLWQASPDLLDALKALLRECVDESGTPLRPSRASIAAAQAAVRKAVGL